MPREVLPIGLATTLVQNQVYALPARAVTVFSNLALQVSNDPAFATSQAIVAVTPTPIAAMFIRCTVGAPLVVLKTI